MLSIQAMRRLLGGLLLGVLSGGLHACGDLPSELEHRVREGAPPPPNLILIVTDDMALGETSVLPGLEALAAERGVVFTNAFVTTPQCGPSRASILTGLYVHNHRSYTNREPFGGFTVFRTLGLENSTIATWLQGAGYETALVGKYLNHYGDESHPDREYVPPGWDEWYALSPGTGRGTPFFDFDLNENGTIRSYSGPDEYTTDVYRDRAVDFLRRRASDSTSVFLYLATLAPHEPATPAPRHQGRFGGSIAPRTASFNEPDVADKPPVMTLPLLEPAYIAWMDGLYQRRVESLVAVDEMIDSIVAVLADKGVLDNTYIVFASDNGFHMGQHRLKHGKSRPYEEDLRVPLIVIGPTGSSARRSDRTVLNTDLAPTLAELAGVPTPGSVDGTSFATALDGSILTVLGLDQDREVFLAEHWNGNITTALVPQFFQLRTPRYSYAVRPSGQNELYDLTTDPDQLDNFYETADPALIARLEAKLGELVTCAGAGCAAAESEF